ncbi:hypothetical protein K461DRAFT_271918 [Myriangium duriaei CBS 260.36]|uniref:Exosome complex component CSL4 C-terminal domain-containing protein n=1 Tax=Myriangium duriaei CBS 260.36 TaxID=1168546 RepID=A0A9P4IU40_9PEZI|nr:hypothetical protein K461DRAFT_271918 [Myriangium duriaei CBS 260.36]
MSTTQPQILLPGDSLPPSHPLGQGTFLPAPSTPPRSSLLGILSPSPSSTTATAPSIITPPSSPAALPTVGATVLARVIRITTRQAQLELLAITSLAVPDSTTPLPFPHQALLRVQDVRATEVDKVVMAQCYRVGDVVRAKVISLGDERSYYLSTAGNEFGVVLGWSREGRQMMGVGWGEMMDERGQREGRKVAKVV